MRDTTGDSQCIVFGKPESLAFEWFLLLQCAFLTSQQKVAITAQHPVRELSCTCFMPIRISPSYKSVVTA